MTSIPVDQALGLALQQHQSGHLAEAEKLYRQILAQDPNHPDALHLLGLLAAQARQLEMAVSLVQRAIELRPNVAVFHANLSGLLRELGKAPEAVAAAQRAIALQDDLPQAYFNLGNALKLAGQLDEAVAAFRRSVQLKPDVAEAHCNLGATLTLVGKADEAIAECLRAIELRPTFALSHVNLGHALKSKGQVEEAIAAYRRALQLQPDSAETYGSVGLALIQIARFDEAIPAFQRAVALKPTLAMAHRHLGVALGKKGRHNEALTAFRKFVELQPGDADAYIDVGMQLRELGSNDQAIDAYRKAIELDGTKSAAHYNLGNALRAAFRPEEAIACYQRAIAHKEDMAEAHNNLATAYQETGQYEPAIKEFHRAMELRPGLVEVRYNLGLVRLLLGDLEQGWRDAEYRWHVESLMPARPFKQPLWDGKPLNGRTILLHFEQGMGDTIQLCRYAPMVAAAGGKVRLWCQSELVRVMRSLAGVEQLVTTGLPDFQVHCPLLTLPLAFETRLETIPANVPYLRAEEDAAQQWGEKLAQAMGKPKDRQRENDVKVGLVWAGLGKHKNDHNRSMSLRQLTPLGRAENVAFVSLQKGPPAAQAAQSPPPLNLIDLTAGMNDFADTAALMANLHLVICVDTAVAHLAGALGKPVWIMIPYAPDWRWLLDREDSPWYPTARLFRQRKAGDWAEVVERVAAELHNYRKGDLSANVRLS